MAFHADSPSGELYESPFYVIDRLPGVPICPGRQYQSGDGHVNEQDSLGLIHSSDYSYDVIGKPIGFSCADVTSFDDPSQNVYFAGSENSMTWWSGRGWFSDIRQCQEQVESQPQPYYDHRDQLAAALPTTVEGQSSYMASSPPPEIQRGLIPTFASEDTQVASTPHITLPPTGFNFAPFSIGILPLASPEIHHTPLLPDQHSTYSELAANLAYMTALSPRSEDNHTKGKGTIGRRRKKKTANNPKEKRSKKALELPDPAASALISTVDWTTRPLAENPPKSDRHPSLERDSELPDIRAPIPIRGQPRDVRRLTANSSLSLKKISPPGPSEKSVGGSSGKKLGLACLFCRERKIACGRPSESHPDQTCNQCARRMFKCEYPTESRRGQHKRPKSKPGIT